MIQLLCDNCRIDYQLGERFCARCGRPLRAERVENSNFATQWKMPVLIGIGAALLLVTLILRGSNSEQVTMNRSAPKPAKSESRAPNNSLRESGTATVRRETPAQNPIVSFRAKLMSAPYAEQLFLAVEAGSVSGVAKVQVSNFWFEFKPYQKRQMTQMIANAWAAEMQGEPAILPHL